MMLQRTATITRKTTETSVALQVNLDGTGLVNLQTGIPFFDHMLTLWARHGYFDLTLDVQGDLEVDAHHTVEDSGICLGQAVRQALGEGRGIARYASGLIPMDEALCQVAIDVSGRSLLSFDVPLPKSKIGEFDVELLEEFFRSFVMHAGLTVHIKQLAGSNLHHILESCFKALGVVLSKAVYIDPQRRETIPSTKGIL